MKKQSNILWLAVVLLLFVGSNRVAAQQEQDPIEDIFDQLQGLLQSFGQGEMFPMDSLMMDFEFQEGLDSLEFGFGPDMMQDFPGFFFSDTLNFDSEGLQGLNMDFNLLFKELSESMESLDPSYFEGMEELLRQFKANGINPDEEFILPDSKPKKKNRVYKI